MGWKASVSTKFKETSQRLYFFGEQRGKSLEFANVPFVEGKQQFLQPFMLGLV